MIIKDNRPVSYVDFNDLKEGDVFYEVGCETILFMKTMKYESINAVDLEDGRLIDFCGCEEVVKVNATVTIE